MLIGISYTWMEKPYQGIGWNKNWKKKKKYLREKKKEKKRGKGGK